MVEFGGEDHVRVDDGMALLEIAAGRERISGVVGENLGASNTYGISVHHVGPGLTHNAQRPLTLFSPGNDNPRDLRTLPHARPLRSRPLPPSPHLLRPSPPKARNPRRGTESRPC